VRGPSPLAVGEREEYIAVAHGGLAHFLSFEQTVVMYSTADSVKGKAVRRGRRLVNCGTGKPGLEVRRSAAGRGREQVEDVELDYVKDRSGKV